MMRLIPRLPVLITGVGLEKPGPQVALVNVLGLLGLLPLLTDVLVLLKVLKTIG